jgi:hypothetical protein
MSRSAVLPDYPCGIALPLQNQLRSLVSERVRLKALRSKVALCVRFYMSYTLVEYQNRSPQAAVEAD